MNLIKKNVIEVNIAKGIKMYMRYKGPVTKNNLSYMWRVTAKKTVNCTQRTNAMAKLVTQGPQA